MTEMLQSKKGIGTRELDALSTHSRPLDDEDLIVIGNESTSGHTGEGLRGCEGWAGGLQTAGFFPSHVPAGSPDPEELPLVSYSSSPRGKTRIKDWGHPAHHPYALQGQDTEQREGFAGAKQPPGLLRRK